MKLNTVWEKEILLIMRNFFVCHNAFKIRLQLSDQKASVYGKELTLFPNLKRYPRTSESTCGKVFIENSMIAMSNAYCRLHSKTCGK